MSIVSLTIYPDLELVQAIAFWKIVLHWRSSTADSSTSYPYRLVLVANVSKRGDDLCTCCMGYSCCALLHILRSSIFTKYFALNGWCWTTPFQLVWMQHTWVNTRLRSLVFDSATGTLPLAAVCSKRVKTLAILYEQEVWLLDATKLSRFARASTQLQDGTQCTAVDIAGRG